VRISNPTISDIRRFDEALTGSYKAPLQGSSLNKTLLGDSVTVGPQDRMVNFGIIDKHQFQTIQKVLHQFKKFPEGTIESILRKSLLAPLKVVSLFNFAFTLGNSVDITLKNMKATEGGMTQSYTLIQNTWRAMRMHKIYTNHYRKALDVLDFSIYDNYSKQWIEGYERFLRRKGELSSDVLRDLEIIKQVDEFLGTEAAASEVNQMLLRMSLDKIGKGQSTNKWDKAMTKIFFSKLNGPKGLNLNPFSANLELNGRLEIIGRLGLHLDDLEKGLTKNESLAKILRTHFNYSNKTTAEMYAEFMVPFISYPLRSFEYWSEALFESGIETRAMLKVLDTAWGDELEDNSYAQYQMSRGNLPIGNTALQTGFTFMDAMQMSNVSGDYGVLPDQLMRKINPVIKNLVTDPAFKKVTPQEGLQRMPVYSNIKKLANVPTAFQQGDVTEMFPAIADPYYKGSFNTTRMNFQYRNPNLLKPMDSNSLSFRMFGKYAYSPMDRISYRFTNGVKR
jgi:hypothetical protein